MTHEELLERVTEAIHDTHDVDVTDKHVAQAAMNVIANYCLDQAQIFKSKDEWDAEYAFKWVADALRE